MPTDTTLYALVDHRLSPSLPLGQVIEFYGNREKADETLSKVLRDEPRWAGSLEIVALSIERPEKRH